MSLAAKLPTLIGAIPGDWERCLMRGADTHIAERLRTRLIVLALGLEHNARKSYVTW